VARSSSVPVRVRGIRETIVSSANATEAATAAAEPPPGVGAVLANSASNSRKGRSVNRAMGESTAVPSAEC
jgi:hypothetical protein